MVWMPLHARHIHSTGLSFCKRIRDISCATVSSDLLQSSARASFAMQSPRAHSVKWPHGASHSVSLPTVSLALNNPCLREFTLDLYMVFQRRQFRQQLCLIPIFKFSYMRFWTLLYFFSFPFCVRASLVFSNFSTIKTVVLHASCLSFLTCDEVTVWII